MSLIKILISLILLVTTACQGKRKNHRVQPTFPPPNYQMGGGPLAETRTGALPRYTLTNEFFDINNDNNSRHLKIKISDIEVDEQYIYLAKQYLFENKVSDSSVLIIDIKNEKNIKEIHRPLGLDIIEDRDTDLPSCHFENIEVSSNTLFSRGPGCLFSVNISNGNLQDHMNIKWESETTIRSLLDIGPQGLYIPVLAETRKQKRELDRNLLKRMSHKNIEKVVFYKSDQYNSIQQFRFHNGAIYYLSDESPSGDKTRFINYIFKNDSKGKLNSMIRGEIIDFDVKSNFLYTLFKDDDHLIKLKKLDSSTLRPHSQQPLQEIVVDGSVDLEARMVIAHDKIFISSGQQILVQPLF